MKMFRNGFIVVCTIALLAAGCGKPLASDETRPETVQRIAQFSPSQAKRPFQALSGEGGVPSQEERTEIALVSDGGATYVPLLDLIQAIGYQYEWDAAAQTYRIGDTDPIYEIRMGSNEAVKEEEALTLPKQARFLNGAPYLPLESFERLFQGESNYVVQGSKLILQPVDGEALPNPNDDGPGGDDLEFGEDPADPAAGEGEVWLPLDGDPDALPALKDININSLITTARQYLGVKYKFSAKPYSSSYRYFDCSSFTRFVYGKYGVSLPRTARAQAKRGIAVSRKNLRRGDLLFFYVPGRFKSNKTVGHVGIYIGNGKMIHASPEPKNGVQISSINNAYWKKTYLRARRVAK
jgi:hypothetical protein